MFQEQDNYAAINGVSVLSDASEGGVFGGKSSELSLVDAFTVVESGPVPGDETLVCGFVESEVGERVVFDDTQRKALGGVIG